MTPTLFRADGKPIPLADRVGKGGEGEVYALRGDGNRVLKLYTVQDIHTREPKIRHVVAEKLAARSPVIAFPIELVFDKAGNFAGFIMARIRRMSRSMRSIHPEPERPLFRMPNIGF